MERYVDEGAKTYSPLAARNEAAPRFQPESRRSCFDLKAVIAPIEKVSVFRANPSPGLLQHYVRSTGIVFPVHPETWTMPGVDNIDEIRSLSREAPIRVAPTASTRTVFALDRIANVPRHYIKLHYPVRISRFNRRLRRRNIQNSVAVTRDIANFASEKFAYLPDVLGFTFGADENSWGALLREAVPRPVVNDRFLIPCFALYAGDANHPDDPPLIVQMIERVGIDPASFAINEIFVPVVECWSQVARERGFLLESHAQNTLLEIDRNFRPRRVVHRDFDVWIDLDVRRRAGLDAPFIGGLGIGADTAHPADQYYSIVYDRFIGHEFFDYLLNVLKRFYAIDEELVRSRVRMAFHRTFPDADRFFPKATMFYFSKEPPPGKEFALEDMRQAPVWR
jgi:hypothetical protein